MARQLGLLMESEDDIGITRRQRFGNARTPQNLVPCPRAFLSGPPASSRGGSEHTITGDADGSVPVPTYHLGLRGVHAWGGSCGYEPAIADAPFPARRDTVKPAERR